MVKKYEVEQMVKDAVEEMNGIVDSKLNQDGNRDLYFVNITDTNNGILVDFETWLGGSQNDVEHDKYLIKVEYVE